MTKVKALLVARRHLKRIGNQYERVLLKEDIDLLETWLGLAFLLRGIWMLHYQQLTLPPSVHEYLVPTRFTVSEWGMVLMALGAGQISLGVMGSRRSRVRAAMATTGACVQASGLYAYFRGDAEWLGVVPMVIVIVLGEMFIAYRAWKSLFQPTTGLPIERRHYG